ncbi:MAG: hypothetical protein O9972_39720 [Burkholderiales bacterium]|nr:hypothetical protein [Burkholderiales bacterium]
MTDNVTRLRETLEAAEHWLAEESASKHPGQTRPDDILRVIRETLAATKPPADASAPAEMPTGFDQWIERAEREKRGDDARRMKDERRMAVALVDRALRDGYSVSVHDSEEWTVKRERDRAVILGALATTGDDKIALVDKDGVSVGWFWLIYGNSGWDVVSDHSANPICDAIWNETLQPLSDEIEAGR